MPCQSGFTAKLHDCHIVLLLTVAHMGPTKANIGHREAGNCPTQTGRKTALRHLEKKSNFCCRCEISKQAERAETKERCCVCVSPSHGRGSHHQQQSFASPRGLQPSCPLPPLLPATPGLSLLLLVLTGVSKNYPVDVKVFRDIINIVQVETDFFFFFQYMTEAYCTVKPV